MLEYFHILQKAIFEMNRTFWTMKCEETQVSPENGIYNRKQESKKTRKQESKNSTKKVIKKKESFFSFLLGRVLVFFLVYLFS